MKKNWVLSETKSSRYFESQNMDDKTIQRSQEPQNEIEKYIVQQYSWENLPHEIKKSMAHSQETWKQKVIQYSIHHQMRWKTNNLIKLFVTNEKNYYKTVLRFSRLHFMVCCVALKCTECDSYIRITFKTCSLKGSK